MSSLRPFQIVLLGLFAFLAVAGLIIFANFQGEFSAQEQPYGSSVIIWGTLPERAFNETLRLIVEEDEAFRVVEYVQFDDDASFNTELLNAIAEGRSPDLIVFPHDTLVTHRGKLAVVDEETFPRRAFRDLFIDGADIFYRPDGLYGLPFAIDPLVMYWNRDIFAAAGLAAPPATWEALVASTVPAIVRVTLAGSIAQSAVAFGEYQNVRHAKEVLSLLFLQAGTRLVEERDGRYTITLINSTQEQLPPADAALSFYTQFANPAGAVYSWNRAQAQDRLSFLGGMLALYFGPGSEFRDVLNANPNLNADIAEVPQAAQASARRTFGRFYSLGILRASGNQRGAYRAAAQIASVQHAPALAALLDMAPVHRAALATGATGPGEAVVFRAALVARGWLDPNPAATSDIFKMMVEDVTSGRARVSGALADATERLRLAF